MSLSKSMRRSAGGGGGLGTAEYYNANYNASVFSSTSRTVSAADFTHDSAVTVMAVVFLISTQAFSTLSSVTINDLNTSLFKNGDLAMAVGFFPFAPSSYDVVMNYSTPTTNLCELITCAIPARDSVDTSDGGDGVQTSFIVPFTAGIDAVIRDGVVVVQDDETTEYPEIIDLGSSWARMEKVHENSFTNSAIYELQAPLSTLSDEVSASGGSGLRASGIVTVEDTGGAS